MIERDKEYYNQKIGELYSIIENQEKIIRDYQEELQKADSITQSCIFEGKEESIINFRECLKALENYKQRIDKAIEYINKYESIKAYYEYEECGYEEYNYDNDFKDDLLEILKGE